MSRSIRVAPEYFAQVKLAIKRNGFPSQKALATELGFSRSTVSNFVNGKPVDYLTFVEICEKLGLDWQAIIDTKAINEGISDLIDGKSKADASAFAIEVLTKFKDEEVRGDSEYQIPRVKENLTEQPRPKFIGREKEQNDLMEYLSEEHSASIITVDGIGGVGKTALVLEVAYRCLEASQYKDETVTGIPKFESIIFVSAKENKLTPVGIVDIDEPSRTLHDIFQVIAATLNDSINQEITEQEQRKRVKEILGKQRTLLIVDNLESVANKEEIKDFLFNLPRNIKSVITTRDQYTIYVPIRLKELPKHDSLALIKQQTQFKNISPPLSEENINKIYIVTKGIPLAIVYAIGRLGNSDDLEMVIESLEKYDDDLAKCLFKMGIGELKEKAQPAYKLLMSLAIFPFPPLGDAVVEVAGLKTEINDEWRRGFQRLKQLSFVYYNQQDNNRYEMLSLTREYALAELRDEANEDFYKKALERRVKWGLKFAREHGGEDWKDWHFQYKYIEKEWGNLVAVLEWCSQQSSKKYYDYFRDLWKELNRFANIYGYWRERLKWLDWLQKASIDRNELPTAVYAMAKQGWTLTLKGRPQDLEKADKMFREAWNFRNHAELGDLIYLANHFAALCIRQEELKPTEQRQYQDATEWLNKAHEMYKQFCTDYPDQKEKELTRLRLRIPYYEAQIHYYQEDYPKAKELLEEVRKDAEESEWQRVVVDANNWLADVLIKQVELVNNLEEADNLLKKAENHLKAALEVAKSNQNKRRVALCQRSYARLESTRPEQERNPEEIRKWAEQAIKGFDEDELEMTTEANEMRDLIVSLGEITSQ
jgi:LuxR family glucitol operon transcriptional activator